MALSLIKSVDNAKALSSRIGIRRAKGIGNIIITIEKFINRHGLGLIIIGQRYGYLVDKPKVLYMAVENSLELDQDIDNAIDIDEDEDKDNDADIIIFFLNKFRNKKRKYNN